MQTDLISDFNQKDKKKKDWTKLKERKQTTNKKRNQGLHKFKGFIESVQGDFFMATLLNFRENFSFVRHFFSNRIFPKKVFSVCIFCLPGHFLLRHPILNSSRFVFIGFAKDDNFCSLA